jgi:hypothetical protein
MASINASTAGVGGVITTADNTGILNIQSGGTTVAAVTSTGVALTGGLSVNGGTFGAATLTTNSVDGVAIGGKTGSTSDFSLYNPAGSVQLLRNPTGTSNLVFGGNLGLGVTPSAWQSNFKVMEIGFVGSGVSTNASGKTIVASNYYFNSGDKFAATGFASLYQQASGVHYWGASTASGTAGGAITFTSGMTLDASGNLGIGNSSAAGKLEVYSPSGGPVTAYFRQDGANAIIQGVVAAGALRFNVANSGNVTNLNNSYGAISDIKLKENIVDTSPKLDKLNKVRIVNYNLKETPNNKQIGVVAQELETIFPSLIEETEDRKTVTKTREVNVPAVDEVLDEEGNVVTPAIEATTKIEEYTEDVLTGETTKSVKYSVFVPILIKAMQEQQVMIQELKAEIDLLKGAK